MYIDGGFDGNDFFLEKNDFFVEECCLDDIGNFLFILEFVGEGYLGKDYVVSKIFYFNV